MDFHSLMRRDLQFLCKMNKIPANMTNLAMADALKALEIVEGLDKYTNQSPTSLAKHTATRTTRRKTTVKAQSSSQLVSGSTSKSLAGEMDQENVNKNVALEPMINNAAKTHAVRSTRKASVATSCSSKVHESKKSELVQSLYSTRRSTRLLEKCMGDLSLKTKEILDDKPEKNEETEQKVSAQEENPAGLEEESEEAEVIPGRDLNVTMEKEWEMLKNDSDQVDGNVEKYVDANTETNKEEMNEVMVDEKESVHVDNKEEVTLQPDEDMCEEGSKKNDNDQEIGDIEVYDGLGDIPVMEHANTESNNVKKESENVLAFENSVQVDQNETEQVIQENDSEAEKINTFDEKVLMDQIMSGGDSETEPEEDKSGVDSVSTISEAEKINTFDEEIMMDQTGGGDSETEPEEVNSGVDSDSTISEADSNQAVLGSDIAEEEMILSEAEGSDAVPPASPPLLLEEAKVETTPFLAESISVQFPRPTTPLKSSALKLVSVNNENKENNMEMMMMSVVNNENGESKVEAKKKKMVEIDEEKLEDLSLRQLEKMVKQLSIKTTSNRPALQILPSNNQIAE